VAGITAGEIQSYYLRDSDRGLHRAMRELDLQVMVKLGMDGSNQ